MESGGKSRASESRLEREISGEEELKIPLKTRNGTIVMELTAADGRLTVSMDGKRLDADPVEIATGLYSILLDGESFEAHARDARGDVTVTIHGREYAFRVEDPREWGRGAHALEAEGRQHVAASMPGKIVRVLVAAGQIVNAGQGLAVIEAMKMQNEVRAPRAGRVIEVSVASGQAVATGVALLRLE